MCLPVIFALLYLLVSVNTYSQTVAGFDTSKVIFEKVDIEASFTGGEQAWKRFLERNLNPNVPVDNGAPSGRYTVRVQFVVDIDGSISEIKLLTQEGYGMEEEVVRILKKSGKWSPAQVKGRAVKAYRYQPVSFMMMEDGFDITTKVPYTLFTGTDNVLTIEVPKVKSENLEATISEGMITKTGDGVFVARVTKPGRVLIKVLNSKKNNKQVGSMSFEVKELK